MPRGRLLPEKIQELPDAQTVVQLVAAGVSVSLHIGDPDLLRSYGVAYRAVDNPDAMRKLAVARRLGERSPVVDALLGVVEKRAESLYP